jgi:broad specificity phosphatase PhoE
MEFSAMGTSLLNELDGGNFTDMTLEQIERDFPEIWAERERDPLHFRFPGSGSESYSDVIGRLRPIILDPGPDGRDS